MKVSFAGGHIEVDADHKVARVAARELDGRISAVESELLELGVDPAAEETPAPEPKFSFGYGVQGEVRRLEADIDWDEVFRPIRPVRFPVGPDLTAYVRGLVRRKLI